MSTAQYYRARARNHEVQTDKLSAVMGNRAYVFRNNRYWFGAYSADTTEGLDRVLKHLGVLEPKT